MLQYTLKLSTKRRTIAIIIDKDLSIKVLAPKRCNKSAIDNFIIQKQNWIEQKIQELQQKIKQSNINTKYSNEAIFWYLGEKYTLLIIEATKNKVQIVDQNIIVYKKPNADIKKLLNKYFIEISNQIFNERLDFCYNHFYNFITCKKPILKIKFMKSRWGSMSSFGIMTLNAKLIYADINLIDYVIYHELCHIKHKNHGKGFYDLFTQVFGDWKQAKQTMKLFFITDKIE